ncbi:replicative DNA helicase [Paenibacillus luteus]|uniref:replicative DNA helicase n=1 Tax=Paenibacillus luteus TaxID=2545753 RepID=UPI001F4FE59B|nr:replicative DNA helicase [Paenibacillus luteus]
MDHYELDNMISDFHERMSRIALFDPLFELQRKKQTDAEGQSIDLMELGMLTLLFFFEQKLMRNNKASVKELAIYLFKIIDGKHRIELADCEELARSIIQVFRPASGKKREFSFYNWEARERGTVYTSILRANAFDSKTNTQYYALDEDGLELVFATKEFYSEFQLSIHQLVLRKQLEKGEFQGALRQINEMRVEVESLQERMIKLEHEIKRSIVSEETLKRYSNLLEDIYTRLQRENEEFDELRQFVNETRMRLYTDNSLEKQQRAYEYILRIASELEMVHSDHSGLLKQSMDLKNQALSSAKESLYYTGLSSFNFDQDISNYIMGTPLPLQSLKGIVSPFIGLEQTKSWSPLTVFGEQSINGAGEHEARDEVFLEAAGDARDIGFMRKRRALFVEVMELLIQELDQHTQIELLQLLEWIKLNNEREWLALRSFYDFWLIIHQRSPVRALSYDQNEEDSGLEEVFNMLGNRVLLVQEASGIIKVDARYHIQNMKLTWGEEQDGL